jgi:hypothetical protein
MSVSPSPLAAAAAGGSVAAAAAAAPLLQPTVAAAAAAAEGEAAAAARAARPRSLRLDTVMHCIAHMSPESAKTDDLVLWCGGGARAGVVCWCGVVPGR